MLAASRGWCESRHRPSPAGPLRTHARSGPGRRRGPAPTVVVVGGSPGCGRDVQDGALDDVGEGQANGVTQAAAGRVSQCRNSRVPSLQSARTSTRRAAGQPRQRQPGGLDVVRGGIRARVAWVQHDASGSPYPSGPWSAQAVIGWNPNVFFHVGAACSFSEWAVTIVASKSTATSLPSPPGRPARPAPTPARGPRPGRRG